MSFIWTSSLSDEALRIAYNTHVAAFKDRELSDVGRAILDEIIKRMESKLNRRLQ